PPRSSLFPYTTLFRSKMGSANLKSTLSTGMAELSAVCDVYDKRLQEVKEEFGQEIFVTKDYTEILSHQGVDAVIIATPDHLHQQDRKSTRLNSSHVKI